VPGVQTPGDVFGAGSEDVPDRKLVSPFSKLPVSGGPPRGDREAGARNQPSIAAIVAWAEILYAAQGLGVD